MSEEEFRNWGMEDVAYVRQVKSDKFLEERPDLENGVGGYDGILFVGTAANGSIIAVSDNEATALSELRKELEVDKEQGLQIERLH